MKKFGICLVLVFIVIGSSCFAQSNNDAQRIVGTWVDQGGYDEYVLNSNGTCSGRHNGRYFISGGKLIFSTNAIYDYYLSSDGRTLFLIDRYGSGTWFNKQ